MSIQGSNDDCYFYYSSSCPKGNDCPFRHCQAALGTETVCSLWRKSRCFRNNCKFRHMENQINRTSIQCFWEEQPRGCLKPHCVFLHSKPRPNIFIKSKNNGYDPSKRFVCLKKSKEEGGPKTRILKRKIAPVVYAEKCNPSKKSVCLKKSKEEDSLDFKIKTLDEIRREKLNKYGNEETVIGPKSSPTVSCMNRSLKDPSPVSFNNDGSSTKEKPVRRIRLRRQPNESDSSVLQQRNERFIERKGSPTGSSVSNGLKGTSHVPISFNSDESIIEEKSFRKIKIWRTLKEPFSNSSIVQEVDSSTDSLKKERAQTIFHGVQNISEEQNKVDVKGKRKDFESNGLDERSPKQLKSTCPSPLSVNIASLQSVNQERQVKSTHPIINRKRSSTVLLQSSEIKTLSSSAEVLSINQSRATSPVKSASPPAKVSCVIQTQSASPVKSTSSPSKVSSVSYPLTSPVKSISLSAKVSSVSELQLSSPVKNSSLLAEISSVNPSPAKCSEEEPIANNSLHEENCDNHVSDHNMKSTRNLIDEIDNFLMNETDIAH